MREQIQDSATGFLTPPRDAEAMAARVMKLIEDEELRLRWARRLLRMQRGDLILRDRQRCI
jgi:glycosyltransferase involved in cell wall biosynthesis